MAAYDAPQLASLSAFAEASGFVDLWTAEEAGYDAFTPLAIAAVATHDVRLGTSIVGSFTRGPAVLAQHAAALATASQGRFVLGLGASSESIVRGWNGIDFDRPVTQLGRKIGSAHV